MKTRLIILLLLLVATGCASRREEASALTQEAGWQRGVLSAGSFDLAAAWAPRHGNTLWVYVEGDGLAYLTPTWPSSDPTPRNPIGLRLALAHPGTGPVAYLARPCQYIPSDHTRNCEKAYWTSARYAPEVIGSVNKAIDILKAKTGASRLVLVGYSGGGAVAVLAAAQRKDVVGIATVAADLDTSYWTHRDGLTPLTGSLNPADAATAVAAIPQVHFTGARDKTVGTDVTRSFRKRFPADSPVHVVEIPGFTHKCCWTEEWPRLIAAPGIKSIFSGDM